MCYTFFFLPMCLRHRTLVLSSQMVNKLPRYSQYFRVKERLQWDSLLRILHLSYSCGWVRKTGERVEKSQNGLGVSTLSFVASLEFRVLRRGLMGGPASAKPPSIALSVAASAVNFVLPVALVPRWLLVHFLLKKTSHSVEPCTRGLCVSLCIEVFTGCRWSSAQKYTRSLKKKNGKKRCFSKVWVNHNSCISLTYCLRRIN